MIKTENLCMDYSKTRGIVNINLEIPSGQIVGLFGENGAGKTTLIKNIVGILKPQKGTVTINDEKLNYKHYNDIACISEELSLFLEWDIAEHLAFYENAFEKFDAERFEKLVEFFELSKEGKVKSFSKGQKAKLELAIGFAKKAKYIFMDEPFLGSDLFTRANFLKLMAAFLEDDDTVVIATHALGEIEQFIDRAIFMKYGKIEGDYPIDEITQKGGLIAVAKNIYDSKDLEI